MTIGGPRRVVAAKPPRVAAGLRKDANSHADRQASVRIFEDDMLYRITTIEPGTGRYTPQVGVPEFVERWAGLRAALRSLRELGYRARRGDWSVSVRRLAEVRAGGVEVAEAIGGAA